ncbi:unnamed protein product, partial [Ostreobium quekettii]
DSGGPLLQADAPRFDPSKGDPQLDVVVGIVSFGEFAACGESRNPDVFTRLSSFRPWIDKHISPSNAAPVPLAPPAPAFGEADSSAPPPSPSVPPPTQAPMLPLPQAPPPTWGAPSPTSAPELAPLDE